MKKTQGIPILILTLILLSLLYLPLGLAAIPPSPREYVTDQVNILSPEDRRDLNEACAQFERETKVQVVVYLTDRIPGGSLSDFTIKACRAWGVGDGKLNSGIGFFVFKSDRKMRIEVGTGLEGKVPDVIAGRIINEVVAPHFKKGQFADGVKEGTHQIFSAARGEYAGVGKTTHEINSAKTATTTEGESAIFVIVIIAGVVFLVFVVFISVADRHVETISTYRPYTSPAPFSPSRTNTGLTSVVSTIAAASSHRSSYSNDDDSSSSPSSSFGSLFSGGGGGFSGGGASGGW